jgi:hypothetical protein
MVSAFGWQCSRRSLVMDVGFSTQKKIAQLGQKLDSTPCTVVSAIAIGELSLPFGSLLVYDDSGLCKVPTTKAHLDKPLGVALRQLYGEGYPAKNPIAALRNGRVWVKCEDEVIPGDAVYVTLGAEGARFTNKSAENAIKLKYAIYLEVSQGGLAPIEVNFLGGAQ